MRAPQPKVRVSVEDYLRSERKSFERHYYLDGVAYAMAGESLQHGYISANILGLLHAQLRGKPCAALTKDTKVRSGPGTTSGSLTKGLFSYPDILVVCGEPEFHDAYKDVICNPTVVLEVLSPSTEAFDRGEKFQRLNLWNPTLKEYVLVSQDKPFVGHFIRQQDGSWNSRYFDDLAAEIQLNSIECSLPLVDVYERVVFPDQESLEP